MEIDIANNIKAVELLKVEIMQKLTDLMGDIAAEPDNETLTNLTEDSANLIALVYILAFRLGLDYDDINSMISAALRRGIADNHILEKRYGDLSRLLENIKP